MLHQWPADEKASANSQLNDEHNALNEMARQQLQLEIIIENERFNRAEQTTSPQADF